MLFSESSVSIQVFIGVIFATLVSSATVAVIITVIIMKKHETFCNKYGKYDEGISKLTLNRLKIMNISILWSLGQNNYAQPEELSSTDNYYKSLQMQPIESKKK